MSLYKRWRRWRLYRRLLASACRERESQGWNVSNARYREWMKLARGLAGYPEDSD